MKTCLNPDCPTRRYEPSTGDEGDFNGCPGCGHRSCDRCGSHYDAESRIADRCPFCVGTGRIDCDDRERDLAFCRGCAEPCDRLDDLEESFERNLLERRRQAFFSGK